MLALLAVLVGGGVLIALRGSGSDGNTTQPPDASTMHPAPGRPTDGPEGESSEAAPDPSASGEIQKQDWKAFKYIAFHRIVKIRDGDTDESIEVKDPDQVLNVNRYPGGNTPERGMPYAAEAKAMLTKFITANNSVVLKVAFTKGGGKSGIRNRWHTLCRDPKTGKWFNPLVPMARKGFVVPFAQREEWAFNEAIMVAAQKAMRDKIGLWSKADTRLRVVANYNPSGSDANNEFADVFNESDERISLENWSLRADGAWGVKQRGYAFPKGAHLAPKGKVRVWVGRKGANTKTEFFWDTADGGDAPPRATFKNPNEDIKSGGMAILLRPLPGTPAAWHVWPDRL